MIYTHHLIAQIVVGILQGGVAPTDPTYYASWEKVGIVGVLIFVIFLLIGSWGLFLRAFLTSPPRFVTWARFEEMKSNYQITLTQKTAELAEYERENRDQNRDIVRLADDFRGVVRDVISTGMKDASGG